MFQLLLDIKNRNFQRLWIAQVISQFGDRVHQFALVGFIAERAPGSALALSKLMACTIVPVFIIQPLAGVIVDRFDRRTVLFICDTIRGFLVLVIAFFVIPQESMTLMYAIVFLIFCFPRFYVPAKMSILPDLVAKTQLLQANSLITTTGMVAAGLGFAFGAWLVEYYGVRTGFIIDAGTFFLSALFVFHIQLPWRIRLERQKIKGWMVAIKEHERNMWQQAKEGMVYIRDHKEIRLILNMLFTLCSALGAIYIVIIVYIQQTFGSVTRDLGILAVSLVVGLLAGVVVYGKIGRQMHWRNVIFSCLFASGLMLVAFTLLVREFPNLWLAIALAFGWGVTIGPVLVTANTMAQSLSIKEMRGQVYSAMEIVIHLGFILTMIISSWLSEFIDRMWILVAVGVIVGAMGLAGLFGKRKT